MKYGVGHVLGGESKGQYIFKEVDEETFTRWMVDLFEAGYEPNQALLMDHSRNEVIHLLIGVVEK